MHRAYLAHVPGTMDEKAFWTRYFKQQYRRMAQRCVVKFCCVCVRLLQEWEMLQLAVLVVCV